VSADLGTFFDELTGNSAWDIAEARGGLPTFALLVRSLLAPMVAPMLATPVEPSKKLIDAMRRFATGEIKVEAQGELTEKFAPVPADLWGFGHWKYDRSKRRLIKLDREGHEIAPAYYTPRVIFDDATKRQKVDEWIAAEISAGRGVKPDEDEHRMRCSAAVGFDVPRQMLRVQYQRRPDARRVGRARKTNAIPAK